MLLDHLVEGVERETEGGDSEEGDQVTRVGRHDTDRGNEEGADDDATRARSRHPGSTCTNISTHAYVHK